MARQIKQGRTAARRRWAKARWIGAIGLGWLGSVTAVACAGEIDSPAVEATEDCSLDGRKQRIETLMRDYYLWYDQIPETLDYAGTETAESFLHSMLFHAVDRWTGMQELVERNQYYSEGRYQGFGYTLGQDLDGNLRVTWSHEGSAAGRANVVRGDQLVAVNGVAVAEMNGQQLGQQLQGDVVEHSWVALGGEEKTVVLERGDVDITSVKSTTVLERPDGDVGYLMFTNFVGPSDAELREAFQMFQQAGVSKLVIDLRYNSGGLLSIAALLGSLIRTDASGQPLIVETYNDRHPEENRERLLFDTDEGVNAEQVVFLTGSRTASASEQVINGLRPYLDVRVVGEQTLGKPVGADSWRHCGYAIVPITFTSLNADGEGDFFEGIEPDCQASDDLLHALGDPEESELGQALVLLEGGVCEAQTPKHRANQKSRLLLPAGPIPGVPGTY